MSDPVRLARHGWQSAFPQFRDAEPRVVRAKLNELIKDASIEQVRAWDDSIPKLQREVAEVIEQTGEGDRYNAILEYELPLDARRPDVILLVRGAIVVLELKGKLSPSQADLDQAAAYARDLRGYHRSCANHPVHVVVVPTRLSGYLGEEGGVHVSGPDELDALVQRLQPEWAEPLSPEEFLSEDAYRPLPTLVQAARELFESGTVRRIFVAAARTDPAVEEITRLIHEAAREKTRKLVLLTGVPGAGKTLVGLRIAHSRYLDDLASARNGEKPTAPAVFLSGNGPLVQVLQYELRAAGGGGQTFVRDVKKYVSRYSGKRALVPPEHVLVFDEAQRAWDADAVAAKHPDTPAKSEPEHFVEFAERIPDWCVVLGLIGTGQEIHTGEEGGLVQWRRAVEGCAEPSRWQVHAPPRVAGIFEGSSVRTVSSASLALDGELRYHLTSQVHEYVAKLLGPGAGAHNALLGTRLEAGAYHLRLTRDLEAAKAYLRERYREQPNARFGVVASSRDKDLERFGVRNGYQDTKILKVGPWYSDPEESALSCRQLQLVVTEFQAQGLELDAVLLAWGTDFLRKGGAWSNARARGYARGTRVRDALQLRLNSYRVLLTRGRDGTVAYVPPLPELDETFEHLRDSGFRLL